MKCVLTAIVFLTALQAVCERPADAKASYPRSDLLIEAKQLARPDIVRDFVILDARPRAKYERGHVPNARWLDHEAWANGFGHGQDADAWSKRIGALGIAATSKVVVYDDNLNKDACRIWWILRYWGVEDVRLLHGGWKAWDNGNFHKETTEVASASAAFIAKPRSEWLATKEQLLKSLGSGKLQIVDARSEREFCGLERMRNKRAGAIPGAKQLEWIDLINKKTGRFKSADELRRLFASAGISLDRPSAAHCQSGGRASVMAFGLELMGSKDVSNYYPSWAEWSSAKDTPIAYETDWPPSARFAKYPITAQPGLDSPEAFTRLLERRWPISAIQTYCIPERRPQPLWQNLLAVGELWKGRLHVGLNTGFERISWYATVKGGQIKQYSLEVYRGEDFWCLEIGDADSLRMPPIVAPDYSGSSRFVGHKQVR
jgi:thiosulfate/3-mercaptopyruvate sulfurtransferase